jgi:hypothetical protein
MTELIASTIDIDTTGQICQERHNIIVLHIFFSCVSRYFSLKCTFMTMSYVVFSMSHI